MALKASRSLTHLQQLHDPEEPVERFLTAAAPLGERAGPILVQLPPSLRVDVPRLDRTLSLLPPSQRVAVEVRHHSWFTDEVAALLTARNVPLVLTDRLGRPLEPLWRTADWGYVRLHEGTGDPWPRYTVDELAAWAERIAARWTDDEDVFVYFNNDPGCSAVFDAIDFAGHVCALGRTATRVPSLLVP